MPVEFDVPDGQREVTIVIDAAAVDIPGEIKKAEETK